MTCNPSLGTCNGPMEFKAEGSFGPLQFDWGPSFPPPFRADNPPDAPTYTVPIALKSSPTDDFDLSANHWLRDKAPRTSGLPIAYNVDQSAQNLFHFGSFLLAIEEMEEYSWLKKTFTKPRQRIPLNDIYDEMPTSLRPPAKYKTGWFVSVSYAKGDRPIVLLHRADSHSHKYPKFEPGINNDFYVQPVASGGPTPIYRVMHPHEYGQKVPKKIDVSAVVSSPSRIQTSGGICRKGDPAFGMGDETLIAGGVIAASPRLFQLFNHNSTQSFFNWTPRQAFGGIRSSAIALINHRYTHAFFNSPNQVFKGMGSVAKVAPYAFGYWLADKQSEKWGITNPYARPVANLGIFAGEYWALKESYNRLLPGRFAPNMSKIPKFNYTQFRQVGGELIIMSGATSELLHWVGGGWGGIDTLKKGRTGNMVASAVTPAIFYRSLLAYSARLGVASIPLIKGFSYQSLGTSMFLNGRGWLVRGGGLVLEGGALVFGVPVSAELGVGFGDWGWTKLGKVTGLLGDDYDLKQALFYAVHGKEIKDAWFPSIKKLRISARGLVTRGYHWVAGGTSAQDQKYIDVYNNWVESIGRTIPNKFRNNVGFPAGFEGLRKATPQTRAKNGKDYFIDYGVVAGVLQEFILSTNLKGTFHIADMIAETKDRKHILNGIEVRKLYKDGRPDLEAVAKYMQKLFRDRSDLEPQLRKFIRKKFADLYHKQAELGLGVSVQIKKSKSKNTRTYNMEQDVVVIKTSSGTKSFPLIRNLNTEYGAFGGVQLEDGLYVAIKQADNGVITIKTWKDGSLLSTKVRAAWNETTQNYTMIMRDTLPAVDPQTKKVKVDENGRVQFIRSKPTMTHTGHVMMKVPPKLGKDGKPLYSEPQLRFMRGSRDDSGNGKNVTRQQAEGAKMVAKIEFLRKLHAELKTKGQQQFVDSIDFGVSEDAKAMDAIRREMSKPRKLVRSAPCPGGCHTATEYSSGAPFLFDNGRFSDPRNRLLYPQVQ